MSTELFDHNGVQVNQHIGPDIPGGDRRWFSIANMDTGGQVSLSMNQWRTLGEFFMADCTEGCEMRLTAPIPDTWKWFDD